MRFQPGCSLFQVHERVVVELSEKKSLDIWFSEIGESLQFVACKSAEAHSYFYSVSSPGLSRFAPSSRARPNRPAPWWSPRGSSTRPARRKGRAPHSSLFSPMTASFFDQDP